MKHFHPKRVDIHEPGLAKVLGELEAKIVEYLWQQGRATARAVCDYLALRHEISFNAVNTVINRLVDKGIARKHKGASYYYYSAAYSRRQLMDVVTQDIFSSLFRDKKFFSVSSFLESLDSLTPKEREQLRQALKK